MKKLLSIMLGLTLVLGAATASFAAQEEKGKSEGKKKGKKKKSTPEGEKKN